MVDRIRGPLLLLMLLTIGAAFGTSGAIAEEAPVGARIKEFSTSLSSTQAGGHPDFLLNFQLGSRVDPVVPDEVGANQVKDIIFESPAGFTGNPHAVAECNMVLFMTDRCPPDAQVGIARARVLINDGLSTVWFGPFPVYNLVPQPGQAGLLAFVAKGVGFPTYEVIHARTGGDYGLNTETKGVNATYGLWQFEQTLWGVPASPEHTAERFEHGGNEAGPVEPDSQRPGIYGVASNAPEKPFLSMPSSCVGSQEARLTTLAYDGVVHKESTPWPATSGCDQVKFNPSQSANPTTEAAESASGLDIVLRVPQSDSPSTPSDSPIKGAVVKFPEGFSINPAAADGKTSCSDAEARLGREDEAQCPEFAKIGTSFVDSWALPGPILGGIYLGEPKPGDRYRIIVTADGFGTHVKLVGSSRLDPRTGQITAVFENLPQAALTEFRLHFFGSERGLFVTPTQCGTYPVVSEFEAWNNLLPNQTSTQFFKVTSGPGGAPCPGAVRGFAPAFRAASQTNGAGAHSPFWVNVSRRDGEQTLSTIGANTPPGFTATLRNVPKCPDRALREIESASWSGRAELANSKCPAGSQVGWSTAGAGAGSKPFFAPGKVYLTGPYAGAPLSFSVVTPALSGPYDLGNVVNRIKVHVDPLTASVTATSDPLPQIVEGIPLRLRSVLIDLDRQGFTLNPTNCDPMTVNALLTGDQGGLASPQSPFQVGNCGTLEFEPKLRAVVNGPVERRGHPALTATVTQDPDGQANLAKAVVTLPHSEFLDQSHIRDVCTRVRFAADDCPPSSVYGKAKAITPLLDEPLEGPVYLRSSSNVLPDLVADLRGPASLPVQVVLVGRIDSPNQQIRTTFSSIPDTPVSKFVLKMQGGKKGLLINSTNICKNPQRIDAKITGQNGASANQRPRLIAPCGKGRKNKGKATHRTSRGRRAGR